MHSRLTPTYPEGVALHPARAWLTRFALLGAVLAVALATTADRADAATPKSKVTAQIKQETLIVSGSRHDEKLALRVRAAAPDKLEIDVNDNGSADIKITRSRFKRILVEAKGGKDLVRIDDAEVGFTETTPTTLDGGSGADTLLGGRGAETFLGRRGKDFVDANRGDDIAFLGRGEDRFQWDPGDGSDTVEGQAGSDELLFNGSGAAENFDVSANGQRVRFLRDVANITMDLDDVENVTTNALGGADTMTVNDLSGTDARKIRTDLAGVLGGTAGDAQADRLIVNATNAADTVVVKGAGGAIDVTGLAAKVALARAEAAGDTVTVNGLGGADTIDASGTAANTLAVLALNGGDLDDVLIGSAGKDGLDGDRGDDVAFMGAGDDTFNWDPGDGSDVVEGQAGVDRLLFNGSGAPERFDVSANGQRVRFLRDVANITMDLDDVENVTTNALGGADTMTVNDVSGTDLAEVDTDLAGVLGGAGGDAQPDQVIVNATNGDDAVEALGDAASTAVTGLPALVRVRNTEAADALVVNALAGDDTVSAATLPADSMQLTVDAGDGDDEVRGGARNDVVLGGDGDDFVDANRGDDVAFMGAGEDRFQWDPGDGSDTVEGQAGSDELLFNGSGAAETFDASANGQRVRFFRDVANITMDLDDVEKLTVNALGGADTITVNDLSGTDLTAVETDLAGVLGGQGGDNQIDRVVANATNGDDAITVAGANGAVDVTGLPAAIAITNAEPTDELVVNGLGGTDSFETAGLAPGTIALSTVQ